METRRPFCTSCGGLLMLSEDDLKEFYEELLKDSQKRRDANNETKQKLINRQIDLLQEMILNQNKLSGFHGAIYCKIEPEVSRYAE